MTNTISMLFREFKYLLNMAIDSIDNHERVICLTAFLPVLMEIGHAKITGDIAG